MKKNRIRNIFSILPRNAFSCWMSLVRQYIGALWIRRTYRRPLPQVKIITYAHCCTERKRKYAFYKKMATNLTSRGLRRNPNVKNVPVLFSLYTACIAGHRVSSKWKKKIFGSNRNKPKQHLFRVCFGLFRETKNILFRFVSVFRIFIETTETNRTVSKRTETIQNFLKNT